MDALLKALLPRCSGAHGSPRKSNACAVRAIRADHEGMTRSKKVFSFLKPFPTHGAFLSKDNCPMLLQPLLQHNEVTIRSLRYELTTSHYYRFSKFTSKIFSRMSSRLFSS